MCILKVELFTCRLRPCLSCLSEQDQTTHMDHRLPQSLDMRSNCITKQDLSIEQIILPSLQDLCSWPLGHLHQVPLQKLQHYLPAEIYSATVQYLPRDRMRSNIHRFISNNFKQLSREIGPLPEYQASHIVFV